MIITNCTWLLFWWLCDDGTSKRKSKEHHVTPTEKRPRDGDQIGWREVEKPQDDDDGHWQLTSACMITCGKSNSNNEKIRSATCCSLYDLNLNPFSIIFRRNWNRRLKASNSASVSKHDLWNPHLMAKIRPTKHVSKVYAWQRSIVTKLKVNNKKPSKKSSNRHMSIRKTEMTRL